MTALVDHVSSGVAGPSAPAAPRPAPATRVAKRAIDVVVGTVLVVALAPLVVLLAAVLAVQLRGWPFFTHHRVGPGLRRMWFPKLRTLPRATPSYADKSPHVIQPVSRLAGFLRRTHLDELPQLILVPFGRLSLVGPRPMMAHELEGVDERWRRERLTVRQGCTGLWQVGLGQSLRVRDSPEYDLAYVRHLSLRLDAWILWRTVRQCVGGRGVALDQVPAWALGRPAVLDGPVADEALGVDLGVDHLPLDAVID
jgi:sugar transferase EpsL